MFTMSTLPQTPNGAPGRVTVIDFLPMPTTYSIDAIQQMRLHENP